MASRAGIDLTFLSRRLGARQADTVLTLISRKVRLAVQILISGSSREVVARHADMDLAFVYNGVASRAGIELITSLSRKLSSPCRFRSHVQLAKGAARHADIVLTFILRKFGLAMQTWTSRSSRNSVASRADTVLELQEEDRGG